MLMVLSCSGCQQKSMNQENSVHSFEAMLDALPQDVQAEEGIWVAQAPDESLRLIWSKNFAQNNDLDFAFEIKMDPFLAVGMEIPNFPQALIKNDFLRIGLAFSPRDSIKKGDLSPIQSYEEIAEYENARVYFDESTNRFVFDLGGGNRLEWAKDLSSSEEDLLFVLNADNFLKGEIDLDNLEGWKLVEEERKIVNLPPKTDESKTMEDTIATTDEYAQYGTQEYLEPDIVENGETVSPGETGAQKPAGTVLRKILVKSFNLK